MLILLNPVGIVRPYNKLRQIHSTGVTHKSYNRACSTYRRKRDSNIPRTSKLSWIIHQRPFQESKSITDADLQRITIPMGIITRRSVQFIEIRYRKQPYITCARSR